MIMTDSSDVPDKADEVVQFFTAHPEFFNVMKTMYHKALSSKDPASSTHPNNLIRHYTRIIEVIAETTIDFTQGVLPESNKERFSFIDHVQTSLPFDKPLPLIWSAKERFASTETAHSTSADMISSSGPDTNSDHESGNLTRDFIYRLAVTRDFDFIYPPDMVSGPIVTPWSYGTLYSVQYPEEALGSSTTATRPGQLDQLHVDLPRTVLDLGRLVVTSDIESRYDGSNWSPSDFIVVVDMQSETKAVWLLCDSDIANTLSRLNDHDGIAEDLNSVRQYFDSDRMDLALLFPSIKDWQSSENTWSVVENRINQSALKLGIHLGHL